MDSNYCWQDDEINSSDQDEKVETLSVQQKLSPDELVDIETKTKNSIIEQTKQFGFHFKQCELIVETAYRVADYIPEKLDNQQDDIWQNKIIPMLIDSLNQDVKFRGVTIDCFSAVRSLTLTIHNTNKILNDSKGSAVAIKIAQKNIPDALKTLDNCIDEAHKLNDSAIETFSEHITDLLKIIGPEAANFTDQIVSLVSAINKYYEKKYNLYNRVVVLEGDRDKYDHLINAIDTYIESLQIDVNNTDKLSDKMEQTKLYLLDIVKNIKDKFLVPKQESTTYNLFGLKLWEKNLIQLILLKIIILIKNRNLSIMKILFVCMLNK
ncbi:uncharacterized protein LOC128952213 [Oppia nitens]|uniref:uncharacterized protein LOC128952213 n=1 Tax=Oppia nitens TaxID=1686743 RepID=UPI0023DBF103|nr:uncharacterized protein LOC128952213 [Oppia nitens]